MARIPGRQLDDGIVLFDVGVGRDRRDRDVHYLHLAVEPSLHRHHPDFAGVGRVCRDGLIPLSSKHPDRVANKLLHRVMRHHTATTGRPPPCYASPYHHNVASTA
jgi:hypothetical protein